jgi:hypothetical protein
VAWISLGSRSATGFVAASADEEKQAPEINAAHALPTDTMLHTELVDRIESLLSRPERTRMLGINRRAECRRCSGAAMN